MSEKLTEIQKIDKNMIFETSIKDEGVAFYDVRKPPFDLYGLCETESGRFHRIPESVAKETNSGVVNLNYHTAGGRVRFKTDSPYVGIKVGMKSFHMMPHMAPTGSSGFDLYVDNDFCNVLGNTGDCGEFMKYTVNLNICNRITGKRGEQHSTQGVTKRLTEASFKGFNNECASCTIFTQIYGRYIGLFYLNHSK